VQQQHCRASAAVADASHGSIGLHRRRLREVVSVRLRTRGGQRHVPGHGSLAHDRFVAVDRVPNRRVRSGQRANATRPRPQLCRQSASAGPLAGGSRPCRVLLLLTLVVLRYIDETNLSVRTRWYVRLAVPAAAVLLPIAFFLSVLSSDASQSTPLVYLAYLGAILLVNGLLILGIGLLRARGPAVEDGGRPRVVTAEPE
jgi:hypothetical protein